MTWLRLAAYVVGGGPVAAGMLIPGAQLVLVPAGTGMLGYATRWPEDSKPPPEKCITRKAPQR